MSDTERTHLMTVPYPEPPTRLRIRGAAPSTPEPPTTLFISDPVVEPPTSDYASATVIGDRYKIESKIGDGSFATTYVAHDQRTGDTVCVKELTFKSGFRGVDMFEREIAVLRRLVHPNIADYLDHFKVEDGTTTKHYLVTRYIPSTNLEHEIATGIPFSEGAAIRIMRDMLYVLKYLHGFTTPIIHRDVSPKNILLDANGKSWLVDFGAASKPRAAFEGTIIGNPDYSHPQHFISGTANPYTDLYALGATMVHLLTGKRPLELRDQKTNVMTFNANISEGFAAVLVKMVDPDEANSFQSADDVLAALEQRNSGRAVAKFDPVAAISKLKGHEEEYEKKLDEVADEIVAAIMKAKEFTRTGVIESITIRARELETILHSSKDSLQVVSSDTVLSDVYLSQTIFIRVFQRLFDASVGAAVAATVLTALAWVLHLPITEYDPALFYGAIVVGGLVGQIFKSFSFIHTVLAKRAIKLHIKKLLRDDSYVARRLLQVPELIDAHIEQKLKDRLAAAETKQKRIDRRSSSS
ncbi:serine/threonine protein kinase [Candidatus Micrarchaeota archaeon]|nr:serine/threonine protein kinase [Candidatus Micrarchaeota archaeon]